jgi:hypothetical protein
MASGGNGSGGTNETPAQVCAPFCQSLIRICGAVLSGDVETCAGQCVSQIGALSASCQLARHDALSCVQQALSKPMARCEDMPRILQLDCVAPLARSGFCRDP